MLERKRKNKQNKQQQTNKQQTNKQQKSNMLFQSKDVNINYQQNPWSSIIKKDKN